MSIAKETKGRNSERKRWETKFYTTNYVKKVPRQINKVKQIFRVQFLNNNFGQNTHLPYILNEALNKNQLDRKPRRNFFGKDTAPYLERRGNSL
jgi:hypothetical protein